MLWRVHVIMCNEFMGRISCYFSLADDSVVQSKTNRCRFTVSVLEHFEFEADDASKVQQVLDACRALGMTQQQHVLPIHQPVPVAVASASPPTTAIMSPTRSPTPALRLQDLDFVRVLGEGAFGQVMLVRKKVSGQSYALKVLPLGEARVEREILATLQHPLIVRLDFTIEHERKLYLGMTYAPGGELYYHLKRCASLVEFGV